MSRYLLLLCLAVSCAKSPDKPIVKEDSNDSSKTNVVKTEEDSSEASEKPISRTVSGNEIVRTVSGSQLPITFSDEFTNEDQKLVIHLNRMKGVSIKAKIIPLAKMQNIRFNNVEYKDQSIDGPFGQDLEYTFDKDGIYSLVIGKSLMADGSQIGKFKVEIQKSN